MMHFLGKDQVHDII